MVRLVWFPGYMDWERKQYTWEIRGQNADVRGARSFAQCVSLVSIINSMVLSAINPKLYDKTCYQSLNIQFDSKRYSEHEHV